MSFRSRYYICSLCTFVVGGAEYARDDGVCRCCGNAAMEPLEPAAKPNASADNVFPIKFETRAVSRSLGSSLDRQAGTASLPAVSAVSVTR